MNIRPYEDADLEAVAHLFTASVHELASAHYTAAQCAAWAPRPPQLEEWRQRLASARTLLAEDSPGGELAGFISFMGDGHIEFLYTAPARAWRGVASVLYRHVETVLMAAQVPVLLTEASLVARPFFERQGFRVIEEQRVYVRGQGFRRFAMSKSLAARAGGH
jgi:putative acetyltransferase